MTLLELVVLADRVGIVAFAISGVLVGLRHRLDLYGLLALGLTTAIGGGIVRDVLLGDLPRALDRVDYLLFAIAASVAAIVFAALVGERTSYAIGRFRLLGRPFRFGLATADAAGTGAFAVTGALLARDAGFALPAALVLAVVTATGGGVIRDVLANRVPLVLRTELNATAAMIGGAIAYLLVDHSLEAAAATGALAGAVFSALGRLGFVRMPRVGFR